MYQIIADKVQNGNRWSCGALKGSFRYCAEIDSPDIFTIFFAFKRKFQCDQLINIEFTDFKQ